MYIYIYIFKKKCEEKYPDKCVIRTDVECYVRIYIACICLHNIYSKKKNLKS